jgi:hypothetical protein
VLDTEKGKSLVTFVVLWIVSCPIMRNVAEATDTFAVKLKLKGAPAP